VLALYHRIFWAVPVTERVALPPDGEHLNMTNASSGIYRAKALAAEKLGREANNYDFKCAWTDIAIEWHALANRAAQEADNDRALELS
jgi:hypothetical protein